jgi:hypothetical protein
MGWFWKKRQSNNAEDMIARSIRLASTEEDRRYWESQADKEYQAARSLFYDLCTEIKEQYSVINNVGSFDNEEGNKLIASCVEAIYIDDSTREKRDYYDSAKYEYCEPYKILSMVYEKRGEFQRAATVCVMAIDKGYTKDGTNGGMRGRLARMIKKGNLPLSDNMKEILNL